jgi:MFS family permease
MLGRRLWVGVSVGWIPLAFLFDGVTVLMLPVRLDGSATNVGLVSLVGLAVATALQPVAGWVTDRWRPRLDRPLFLAAGAIPAIAGVWLLVGTTTVAAAVGAYLLVQLAAAGMQAAQQTLIPERVDRTEHRWAAGLKTTFDVGGSFLAFALLGTLLAVGGLAAGATVITAVLAVTVALVLWLVPTVEVQPRGRTPAAIPPGLLALILARFLFLFGTYAVGRFLVLLVAQRAGIEADRAVDEAALLLAGLTLATAAAGLAIGSRRDRWSHGTVMIASSLTGSLGILVMALPAGVGGVVVGGIVMSVATGGFMTANWAATTSLVAPEASGRLMAIANLGTGMAAAAAGGLGPVIDAFGFGPGLLVAAGASAAALVPVARRGARAAREPEVTTP